MMLYNYKKYVVGGAVALVSCAAIETGPTLAAPQAIFLDSLKSLCGDTVTGAVVSDDPQDVDWAGKVLTVGPVTCEGDSVIMPLAVGEDKSRVWTVKPHRVQITKSTQTDEAKTSVTETHIGLHLSHAHTLKDGSPDPVTGYGGMTASAGTAVRQDFPVDSYSTDLFIREGLTASVKNIWAMEITPGDRLAYELRREGRFFRAEFALNEGE